jgi:hypothetical protein
MVLRSFITSTLSACPAFGAAVASMIVTGAAEARRGAKPYYSETYEFDRPVRGYEGFLFPDYYCSYCSYKRYPKRVCSQNRNGSETCRIKGWTLEQTCQ